MWLLVVAAFVALAPISVWALSVYAPVHSMPLFLVVPLALSIYLPLSIIVLVPADLSPAGSLSDSTRLVLWRVVYWLTFALTWAVLPSLQFYVESGYYDPIVKLKDALRANVRYQLTLAACAIVGLVYMGLSSGLSFTNLKALAIALSHSYALVLTLWLLGHGLVSIPRHIWHLDPSYQVHQLYQHATHVCDAYADAISNYEDAVGKVMALLPIKTDRYSEWIDQLVEDARKHDIQVPLRASAPTPAPSDLNDKFLAQMSKRFYQEQARTIRYRADWEKLLLDAAYYEDICSAVRSGSADLSFRYHQTRFSPRAAKTYFCLVLPWQNRTVAAVLSLASLVIAESEMVFGTSFSLVDVFVRWSGGALQALVAAGLLAYMCACTVTSLANIRVFNLYALVRHDSDPASLLFYAMYACRVAIPLSFNFLMLSSGHTTTVFEQFLGKFINLTPLGKYFNEVLPRMIVVPMALSYFGAYDKLKDYLGLGLLSFDEDEATSSETEGRELVRRALGEPRFRWSLESLRGEHGQASPERSEGGGAQAVFDRVSSWLR